MSHARWLLRAFPSSWRSRYEEEAARLLEEIELDEGRVPFRDRLDLVSAGMSQRFGMWWCEAVGSRRKFGRRAMVTAAVAPLLATVLAIWLLTGGGAPPPGPRYIASIWLNPGATSAQVAAVRADLGHSPVVAHCTYRSSLSNYEQARRLLPPSEFAVLTPTGVPASFECTLRGSGPRYGVEPFAKLPGVRAVAPAHGVVTPRPSTTLRALAQAALRARAAANAQASAAAAQAAARAAAVAQAAQAAQGR